MRTFIPAETAGLVVLLIGVIIGLAALRMLLGDDPSRLDLRRRMLWSPACRSQ